MQNIIILILDAYIIKEIHKFYIYFEYLKRSAVYFIHDRD